MPKSILIKEKEIRGVKSAVIKRHRNVKTLKKVQVLSSSSTDDFELDLETAPHQFIHNKCDTKVDGNQTLDEMSIDSDHEHADQASHQGDHERQQSGKHGMNDPTTLLMQNEILEDDEYGDGNQEGDDAVQFLKFFSKNVMSTGNEMFTDHHNEAYGLMGDDVNHRFEKSSEKQSICSGVSADAVVQSSDGNRNKVIILSVDILKQSDKTTGVESNEDTIGESASSKGLNESKESGAKSAKINIEDLIDGGNPTWEEIVQRYNEDGTMSKRLRKEMNEAIVQYARVKNIYIDVEAMEDISYQICKVFQTETMSSYFLKTAKGYSGSLYNLYHRKRSNDIKERKERSRFEDEEEVVLHEPTESIAILKSEGHSASVYLENWMETLQYRQRKMSKYDTSDDFINEWPIITKEIGFSLLKLDFVQSYGAHRPLTSRNWNLFFSRNVNYVMGNINGKGKTFFRKVSKLEESTAKDAALSYVLHFLLPPAYGAANWKPTYIDSQDTLLKFIKNECVDTEIQNRNKVCEERGIKWHPYIIGQGRSKRKINSFIVVIHNAKIQFESFLQALEFCLYLYILLDIPYPPESKAVWILVNRLFVNVKVENQLTPRIHQLLNDLN